jgi:hypothetical protein
LHRDGLDTIWLLPDPERAAELVERWHCERCQLHQAKIMMCSLCSATVMLGGELASADEPDQVPCTAAQWLASHGWTHGSGVWICGEHNAQTPNQR